MIADVDATCWVLSAAALLRRAVEEFTEFNAAVVLGGGVVGLGVVFGTGVVVGAGVVVAASVVVGEPVVVRVPSGKNNAR